MGEEIGGLPAKPSRAAASLYLIADHEGTLVGDSLESTAGVPGVVRCNTGKSIGDKVGPPLSSADRLAVVILDCPDRASLEQSLAETKEVARMEVSET